MRDIILLHGALGSAADLNPVKNEFEKAGWTPWVFEFSGHGNTPGEDDFGIEVFSGELKSFILDRKLTGCKIFGYSMGGYVALHLQNNSPGLVSGIITLGTKLGWDSASAQKEMKSCDINFLKEKAPAFLKQLSVKHHNVELLLERTAKMMYWLGENNLLVHKGLNSIEISVLLCLGDSDRMVSLEETLHAKSAIKNACLCVLPRCKHPLDSAPIELLVLAVNTVFTN